MQITISQSQLSTMRVTMCSFLQLQGSCSLDLCPSEEASDRPAHSSFAEQQAIQQAGSNADCALCTNCSYSFPFKSKLLSQCPVAGPAIIGKGQQEYTRYYRVYTIMTRKGYTWYILGIYWVHMFWYILDIY